MGEKPLTKVASRAFVRVPCTANWFHVLHQAGKISLVFDAVFSETLRERMSKDVDFKTFIIGEHRLNLLNHHPNVKP